MSAPLVSDPSAREADRVARVALCRLAEPGDTNLGRLVEERGAAEVVEAVRTGALTAAAGRDYRARLDVVDPVHDLDVAAGVGARFVCPGDAEWPAALRDLGAEQPWGLWVRGQPSLATAVARSVAVVGARAATEYGSYVATELAAELCDHGWTVISGAAYGIDAAAHAGALAAGGTTVAVLACGVDLAYPRAHEALISRIAAEGLVVSELAPGVPPNRPRFLVRNRLIAGLSRGTVVVEAAARSGSLSTARHAGRLHRHVMGVPGPVTSKLSVGVHALVRNEQASLVTGASDVLELVAPMGEHLTEEHRGESRSRDGLDPVVARVMEALPIRRSVSVGRIAREAAVAPETALRALGVLDALGLAENALGGWRLAEGERERLTRTTRSDDEEVDVGATPDATVHDQAGA
ncbi:MAG: DNA-processing protein DprA [Actinomycetes bacterium]